jgi:putative copper resistance protein D
MPDLWGYVGIGAKFGLYLGLFTAAGLCFVSLIFRASCSRSTVTAFALLGLFSAILSFLRGAVTLTGDITGITDPTMLALLWNTPVGTTLAMQVGGMIWLIVGVQLRLGWFATLGGVIALLAFNQTGHVANKTLLVDLAQVTHLLAAALWIGILIPLYRLLDTSATYARAGYVGHRFGLVASGVVPALIVAGGYMAFFLLGDAKTLFTTDYGQLLLAKIAVVAGLLGLAAVNKLRLIPSLRNGDAQAADRLRRAIVWEWCAFLAILAVTSVLTTHVTLPA